MQKKSGDILILNGEPFDPSPLQEGEALSPEAIASGPFADPVSRHADTLGVSRVLPVGANLPVETRCPLRLEDVPDGTICKSSLFSIAPLPRLDSCTLEFSGADCGDRLVAPSGKCMAIRLLCLIG